MVEVSQTGETGQITNLSKRLKEVQEQIQADYAKWEALSEQMS